MGTVFKVDPSRDESLLYSFRGGTDGANPNATLIRDKNGNPYGTLSGGAHNAATVFKLTP